MNIDKNFLDDVARDLPIIRPIKEFIHLNLLLPYQHIPFWEALVEVSAKLEAIPFPNLEFYRSKIKSGEIPLKIIKEKIANLSQDYDHDVVLHKILQEEFNFVHHDTRVGELHDQWNNHLNVNVMQIADGLLIKWLSMFFDQGIGHWEMPGSDQNSFYQCIKDLLKGSMVRPSPFGGCDLDKLFLESPEAAISEHLNFLCPDQTLQKEYAKESVLTLRGWAGLIFCIQQNGTLLPFPRKIDLIDFMAVKLILERAWVSAENKKGTVPQISKSEIAAFNPLLDRNLFMAFRICQETMEEMAFHGLLKKIVDKPKKQGPGISIQATFCMDDRECSLRRYLEESPEIETYGTAGHFGIECLYHHFEDSFPRKQCPAPIPVKYLLKDVKIKGGKAEKNKNLDYSLIQPTGNIFRDWFFSHFNAVYSFSKLASNLFFPLLGKNLENVREITPDGELKLLRDRPVVENGLKEGYTIEEMADLVFGQLQLIGFVHHLAPLIFIIGHGSTSENNPYFATYGCGACSGRPGAANARALSHMANRRDVRELVLAKHKLTIPESTYFVAGLHDTCKDVVELYETDKIPAHLKAKYQMFKNHLSESLYKNARERCLGFKLVTYGPVDKDAQKEVLRRSFSLFETRPELGHTNVSFAIVGRRDLTHGLNLARKSFLQSYDPGIDPEGKILAASLGAVIPVCSGISLDYFFSRVDNLRFGAGSKLPQNIVGNIGVSHGTESDLLFGLPFQMIDQHQPQRLFVLVEQKPEVALSAIQGNPLVKQIVYNGWVHYGSYDDSKKTFHLFENGQMVEQNVGSLS